MKRSAIIFFLTITLSNAVAQISARRVVITGKIIHASATTPKVFGINFLNPFDKNRKSATVDSLMEFSVEEHMLFTQNMTIAYNNTFINLYVVPGDTVHLQIDAALLDQPNFEWLHISGDHAGISTRLNLLHYSLSKLPYLKYDYSLSTPGMLEMVKKDYERYLTFLKEYTSIHETDSIVIDFFKRDIKYGISNWIADYVDAGSDSASTRAERIALFSDPFFEYANDANFVSMMYPYHLAYYMGWKIETDISIKEAKQSGRDREAMLSGAKLLLKEPSGISRDYMLFSYLSSYINKMPALQDDISSLRDYFTDPVFYHYLERSADRARNVKVQKTVVSNMLYMDNAKVLSISDVDILNFLSKKYPGKIIYLDVYATWCVPCLKEMEFAPLLHQQFAGKDVVFVNLCLQSSEKNWIKLLQQKKLAGENYFLNDDNSKLLMGNFNISGFPTYLLIDSKGKVKTANASRPSEAEKLEREINLLAN
ncbi:TlpA family protein disulfide reductase [Chitinophaga sp. RAB17]|uniref:TlpA family protein disulfide reductase n=1 Tax=Chitinophaga sp. RAB17 TaxID=3233049 RepID=UPI003F8FF3AF